MQENFVDAFGIMMGYDESEKSSETNFLSVDEMLVESLNNRSGTVDVAYIAQGAGISVEQAVYELRGAIFQCPEVFENGEPYDIEKGWVVSAAYLSGNASNKLQTAYKMNERYKGRFDSNIEALEKILPTALDIEDIHISIGAAWIPVEEYTRFITHLLKLKTNVQVVYNKELSRFKIIGTPESNHSILNTITYGVREEQKGMHNYVYVKQYLTALEIIEQTANAKTIKVYDYVPKGNYKTGKYEYEPVFNEERTIEAQEKQKQIIDAFLDWVCSNSVRAKQFEQYYNEAFVGYTNTSYNGDFLKLPDLNPEIRLFKHQRDAIARVLLSGCNTLFAHDVGTGKTYEIIVSVHELKRMHISEKNLIVVPNNILKATVEAHKQLYKDDKILVVYPKDFTPATRNAVLERIRDEDFTAIYMAYSSFDMIVMSKEYYIEKKTEEINEIKVAIRNEQLRGERKALEAQCNILSKKLAKYILEEKECEWLTFEKLGINTLVVDEAHNYKNIPISSRTDNIVGLSNGGSKKCREMLEKAHFVDKLIFATGTPLTNSLADLFVFQTYLQPGVLSYHGIKTFDSWVNTFGQRETSIECDVDANSSSLRTMTRFASFHNLGELMSLFSQVCDFHHLDRKEEGLPEFNGATDICVPKNKAQAKYIKNLSKRTELIRAREVNNREDNLLKVTTDGRKAALDIRLTDWDGALDYSVHSKIEVCAETVFDVYKRYPESSQIVFSDIGTPKEGFNVYDSLSFELQRLGVKKSEIAFVHDAQSETSRAKLFSDINKGVIRVVIGSTQKLGVGVNVQERLVAIHHLSVPWRPADMVQREGRILRKGNTSEEVFVYRYITEGSFDAYSWQLLENKQRFISSFLSGTSAARSMGDVADAVLSYAEVKALAIGNPLIKKRVEVSNLLERTKIATRSRQRRMQELKVIIETLPHKIKTTRSQAKLALIDHKYYTQHKEVISNDERTAFGEELLACLRENICQPAERVFDVYQGFKVVLPANMQEEYPYVLLRSAMGEYYCELKADKTPLGCSKTIDYLLEHLPQRSENLYERAKEFEKQICEAQADLDKGNPYVELIDSLKNDLEQIDKQIEDSAESEEAS